MRELSPAVPAYSIVWVKDGVERHGRPLTWSDVLLFVKIGRARPRDGWRPVRVVRVAYTPLGWP